MKKESKKMKCIYRDRLNEYLDGKLRRDEKLSFEDHLGGCPECTDLVRLNELAERIIAEEKNSIPGFYLTDRIMNRIKDPEKERVSPLIRILRPAVISISIAAAISAGVLIGNISAKPDIKSVPVELTLMNDIAMESVNVLTGE